MKRRDWVAIGVESWFWTLIVALVVVDVLAVLGVQCSILPALP